MSGIASISGRLGNYCFRTMRSTGKVYMHAVENRKNNLTTLSTDQAAYAAQKDEPGGKRTWKSYLWKVCKEAYEANSH